MENRVAWRFVWWDKIKVLIERIGLVRVALIFLSVTFIAIIFDTCRVWHSDALHAREIINRAEVFLYDNLDAIIDNRNPVICHQLDEKELEVIASIKQCPQWDKGKISYSEYSGGGNDIVYFFDCICGEQSYYLGVAYNQYKDTFCLMYLMQQQ